MLEILEYNPNNLLNINTFKNKVLDLQNRIITQNRCNLSTFAFVKIEKRKDYEKDCYSTKHHAFHGSMQKKETKK